VELPFPIAPLDVGVIIGHTTTTSARVWLRVPNERPNVLTIDGRHIPFRVDPSADFTTVITVDGLLPDRQYPLDVIDDRGASALPAELAPRVRTLPEASDRLSFAFVSCHLPFEPTGVTASVGNLDALLETIAERDVRFVVHLGDQIYADAALPKLNAWQIASEHRDVDKRALYHAIYRGYFGVPAMRRLHARVPNVMVWDDGEICESWGSVQLEGELAPAMFEAARAAYFDYQHAHNPPTATDEFHFSFEAGPASFFVLDLRGHRDAIQRRLLGDRQWAALEGWVAATEDRPFRFVVSSVPPLHTPDMLVERITRLGTAIAGKVRPAFLDRWSADAFHPELERLLALLLPRNIIVLAGDVHIGAASEIHDPNDASRVVHQWISSAITHETGLMHRLESEIVSRITNLATPWPVVQRFHELRNNFGIVELVRRDGHWIATFDLYVHTEGNAAKAVHRIEVAQSVREPLGCK